MEQLSFECGRVVRSLQGRDKGRYFIVLRTEGDQFVWMADGLTRKLDHLKKKKVKHLHPKPILVTGIEEKLACGQLLDSDLRKALKAEGLEIDQPLSKEG